VAAAVVEEAYVHPIPPLLRVQFQALLLTVVKEPLEELDSVQLLLP